MRMKSGIDLSDAHSILGACKPETGSALPRREKRSPRGDAICETLLGLHLRHGCRNAAGKTSFFRTSGRHCRFQTWSPWGK